MEGVTDAVDEAAGEQRGDDVDGVNADGLGVGEERALGAEGVEVGEGEVGGAVLKELVVGELVEDDPDDERMLARRLGRLVPDGGDLVGRGPPCGDPEELRDAGEGEEGEGGGDEATGAHEAAIPLGEAQEEQKNDGGPEDEEERDHAFDEIKRIDGLGALQKIRRDGDGEQEAQPGIEAGAREGGEEEEEQQGEEEEVCDMGEAELGEGEWGVHADIRAATQQVAVVGDEDERGEAERLAESLQHSAVLPLLTGPIPSEGIFSKRRRMRPLARGWRSSRRKRLAQVLMRPSSEREP